MSLMTRTKIAELRVVKAERDKAVEELEGVTDHLMSLLSAEMCDKHRAEIKTESFVTFMQREKDLGCTRCLEAERDSWAAKSRANEEAKMAEDWADPVELAEAVELIRDMYAQASGRLHIPGEAKYSHNRISVYEEAQKWLIERGAIKKEECLYE